MWGGRWDVKPGAKRKDRSCGEEKTKNSFLLGIVTSYFPATLRWKQWNTGKYWDSMGKKKKEYIYIDCIYIYYRLYRLYIYILYRLYIYICIYNHIQSYICVYIYWINGIWHDIPKQLEDAIGVLFVISRAKPWPIEFIDLPIKHGDFQFATS